MIDDTKSSGESPKEAGDKNKAPGDPHRLGMAVQQSCANSASDKSNAPIDGDSHLGDGKEFSNFFENAQLLAVGDVIGFVFGIIFCALLWHI